jgi:exosortase
MPGLSRYRSWGWGIIYVVSLLIIFRQRFDTLMVTWVSDGIYSVCPFVPFISLGLIYLNRNRLKALPVKPSALGLIVVALCVTLTVWFDLRMFGALVLTSALLALTIAGIILALRGWETLFEMAFPIAFLLFLLPVPPRLMFAIDYPLQVLCARATAHLGNIVGLGLECAGAQLQFPDPKLSVLVAPACNGLRSVVSLLAVSTVYAYLLKGKWYWRCTLVAAAIPLAYLGNFVRLLGIVGIVKVAGARSMQDMPVFDAGFGLVAFALPLLLLFFLARALQCKEFQHIG